MTNIDDLLNDTDADASVAMLTKVNNKFCFVIQPQHRWGKTDDGQNIMFFGGIGGKLETGEQLIEALHREALEEIGCDFSLVENRHKTIPIVSKEGIIHKNLLGSPNNPLPIFIFQNKRSEVGRKSKTNIFVYYTKLNDCRTMTPIDNPAIILIPEDVLYEMKDGMPLRTAKAKGVEILLTNIDLPDDGILVPTPTPAAIIKLHEEGYSQEIVRLGA